MFYVPILQDNGIEAYDKYTMKQPLSVDLNYSISIVANKMELLNDMNEIMLYEFNALYAYVDVNGHYMPMNIESISDDSEYDIQDRKYYSQTYRIRLKAYVIREEDFTVEKIPSRLVMRIDDSDTVGKRERRKWNRRDDEKVDFFHTPTMAELKLSATTHTPSYDSHFKSDDELESPTYGMVETYQECPINEVDIKHRNAHDVDMVEERLNDWCCSHDDRYYNKRIKAILDFGDCLESLSFTIDQDMVLEAIETENVYDFKLFVNGCFYDLNCCDDIRLKSGDEITVTISKDDGYKISKVILCGYDPYEAVDTWEDAELLMDAQVKEEQILVSGEDETDKNEAK